MNLENLNIFKDSKKGIISPINKSVIRAIEKFNSPYERALRKGEKTLSFPKWSIWNRCPECGSIFYWELFGGIYQRSCHKCAIDYNVCTSIRLFKKGVV